MRELKGVPMRNPYPYKLIFTYDDGRIFEAAEYATLKQALIVKNETVTRWKENAPLDRLTFQGVVSISIAIDKGGDDDE